MSKAISNPFFDRGPVREPAFFFGHRAEVRKIVQLIGARVPQSCSLIGERRMGKTSLLNYLAMPGGALTEFGDSLAYPASNYIFVPLEFTALKARQQSSAVLMFKLLLQRLEQVVEMTAGIRLNTFEKYQNSEDLDSLVLFGICSCLDEIRRHLPGRVIVFLLDDAEILVRYGAGALLRSMIQDRLVSFVIATRAPLNEIDPESEVSPLFNIMADTISLTMLPAQKAEAWMLYLASQTGASFSGAELNFVLEKGGGHPEFLKTIARRIWDAPFGFGVRSPLLGVSESEPLVSQLDELLPEIATELEPLCTGIWKAATPDERVILQRLASSAEQITLQRPALQKLLRKGLLRIDGRSLQFFSAIFKDFVYRQDHPPVSHPERELRFGEGYVTFGDNVFKLSPIEMKLMQYLASRTGQICTREEIHNAVWSEPYTEGSSVKVNIAIQRLKQKLGILAESVESARGVGYVWTLTNQ